VWRHDHSLAALPDYQRNRTTRIELMRKQPGATNCVSHKRGAAPGAPDQRGGCLLPSAVGRAIDANIR